jgi:hypothetical protein
VSSAGKKRSVVVSDPRASANGYFGLAQSDLAKGHGILESVYVLILFDSIENSLKTDGWAEE